MIKGDKQRMYMLSFLPFYSFLSEFLPQALCDCLDLFGTKDAKYIISAPYSVSGHEKIGGINEYQQFLIDNAYCYFLLRNNDGILINKLFRLDLFRQILQNGKNGFDFNEGLMHVYRHCLRNNNI